MSHLWVSAVAYRTSVWKYSILSSLKRLTCLVTQRMVARFWLPSSHRSRQLEAYLLHMGILFNDKKGGSIHVYTRRKLQVNVSPTYKTKTIWSKTCELST